MLCSVCLWWGVNFPWHMHTVVTNLETWKLLEVQRVSYIEALWVEIMSAMTHIVLTALATSVHVYKMGRELTLISYSTVAAV